MRVAILGGGFVGLTAAYKLLQKNHTVVLYEKEVRVGGLSGGFKGVGWEWELERTYHHIFANDADIIKLAQQTGYAGVFFKKPTTSSLYKIENGEYNYRTFPVDTPQDFLLFPLLSLPEKIRTGVVLSFFKLTPHFSFYEKQTAAHLLKKTMGDRAWNVLWEELFRKKFGKYAEKIVASFIWARIHKRTNKLGYFEGGFQAFINHLEKKIIGLGGNIKTDNQVQMLSKNNKGFSVWSRGEKKDYDVVISTLPNPLFTGLARSILPQSYINRLNAIKYLYAMNLIIETETPLFKNEYWVSVCDKKAPMMVLVQHTNFIDKSHYNQNSLLYVANYLEHDDKRLLMDRGEYYNLILPYIHTLGGEHKRPKQLYLFKAPFAQPIYDEGFVKNRVGFETPIKNLFIANLEMTYPYDRGTNYAVKLGGEVVSLI